MRTYHHTIDETHLRQQLGGPWSDMLRTTRQQLAAGSNVEFNLTSALDVYFDGICYAWALADDNALAQLRQHLSRLAAHTFEEFSADDVQQHSTYQTLTRIGAGDNRGAIHRHAEILNERQRRPIKDRDPNAFSQDLLDSLIHLILDHDGAAQAASVRLYQHLHHPRTPPTVHLFGIPHAVQAVVSRDQASLNEAASFTASQFVNQVAPLRDQAAGPTSLVYPTLSLVCRIATWRGMAWPDSPYILSVPDTPSNPGVSLPPTTPTTPTQTERRAS